MSAKHASKLNSKFKHALDLHEQGKRQQAGKLYRSILNARPGHPGALLYLGVLSHQQGEGEAAIRLIRQAIQQQPGYLDAFMNLGNVYQGQQRFSEAEDCYRKVITHQPDDVSAHSNLGVCLRRLERFDEAISMGRKAVELDPEYLIAWYNLGNAYRVAQKFNQAVVCYQHAIDLKPDFPLAHDGLCQSTFQLEHRSLLGKRSFSKSIAAYEQWLLCEPDNALPQFMLQAIRGDEKLTRAPDSVVRTMFDQFASTFEQHLGSLEYKLPQQLTGLLQELLGPPQASLKIFDGGCGTGLCAPALKPWASKLIGVDISSAMLSKAREKQLYDNLFESELTHFLEQYQAAFDLAVFADTLIYFGDLEDVLRASAHALDSGGTLLFTLEASPAQNSKDYSLHPTGRYSHSAVYVEKILKACGFSRIRIGYDSTRIEVGKAVPGLVVSARKSLT